MSFFVINVNFVKQISKAFGSILHNDGAPIFKDDQLGKGGGRYLSILCDKNWKFPFFTKNRISSASPGFLHQTSLLAWKMSKQEKHTYYPSFCWLRSEISLNSSIFHFFDFCLAKTTGFQLLKRGIHLGFNVIKMLKEMSLGLLTQVESNFKNAEVLLSLLGTFFIGWKKFDIFKLMSLTFYWISIMLKINRQYFFTKW